MKRAKSESVRLMVFGCLLGLLIGCPTSLGQEDTIDFEFPGDFLVLPEETLNLVAGGRITGNLNVYGAVNIRGGEVDGFVRVNENTEATVFGRVFTVPLGLYAGTYADTGTYEVSLSPVDGALEGLYEDETPIVLRIECYANETVTLEVSGAATSGAAAIEINIRPGSEENCIHLGSNGVIPVAILSTAEFDATTLNPANIFLAGANVRISEKPAEREHGRRESPRRARIRRSPRSRRTLRTVARRRKVERESAKPREELRLRAFETEDDKYLATSEEDVNGDGRPDLVVKIEAKNLDPGQLADGRAYLRVHEASDQESAVVYEGWDKITVVLPE